MRAFDLNAMMELAEQVTDIPVVKSNGGGNKFSFGVVNSKNNGKRLSFSKALAKELTLDDAVYLIPIPSEGVLMVAKKLPFVRASVGTLKGDDKKICYGADLVELVTKCFGLDFSKRTSMSFTDIEFDEKDGIKIALIDMSSAKASVSDGSGDVA